MFWRWAGNLFGRPVLCPQDYFFKLVSGFHFCFHETPDPPVPLCLLREPFSLPCQQQCRVSPRLKSHSLKQEGKLRIYISKFKSFLCKVFHPTMRWDRLAHNSAPGLGCSLLRPSLCSPPRAILSLLLPWILVLDTARFRFILSGIASWLGFRASTSLGLFPLQCELSRPFSKLRQHSRPRKGFQL